MFASIDSFLASQSTQIACATIVGLVVAGMIGSLIVLVCKLFDVSKENRSDIAVLSRWSIELCDRVSMAEEGTHSLSQRLAVIEADIAKRAEKAAAFKARIEKAAKSEKKAKA